MNKSTKTHLILSIIYRLIIIFIAVLFVCAIGLKLYFTSDRIKSLTERLIKQTFNRETRIGSFDLSLFRGLVAKDIKIANLPGFSSHPILTIKEIDLQYNFWSIIKKKPQVYRIVVRNPVLSVERNQKGNWNFTDLLQSKLKDYQLNWIEITNAELLVRPYPEFNLTKANVILQDIRPWKPWKFEINGAFAMQPESQISITGAMNVFTLVPTGDIVISVKNLNPIQPFKQQVKGTKLDQLSLITNGTITISSPQSKPITISGAISTENIQHPILQNNPWIGRMEFMVSYPYDSNRIEIPSFKIRLVDFPEITASGSIESLFGESTMHFSIQSVEGNLQPIFFRLAKPYPNLSGNGKINLTELEVYAVPARKIVRIGSVLSLTQVSLLHQKSHSAITNGNAKIGLSYSTPADPGRNPMHFNLTATADKVMINNIPLSPEWLSLNSEFDSNLALSKFTMPESRVIFADTPITIQASGNKNIYQAKITVDDLNLMHIPESILSKANLPKPQGVFSGNIDVGYIPSATTAITATGNLRVNGLSIVQNNKSYAIGNIESAFTSFANLTKRSILVQDIQIKTNRNLAILGTAELRDLGRGAISGQFSIPPISISNLEPYLALISPNIGLTALDGTIAGKGTLSYRPASQTTPLKINGVLDLSGSALRYQNSYTLLSVKTSTITLSFETKEPPIFYSNATIFFNGLETHYANNTVVGDLKGTAEIYTNNQFSQITGVFNLDTSNINIPSSKIIAKNIEEKVKFTLYPFSALDNKSASIPITGQIDNLQIRELVNPWFEVKDISLSAEIKTEKITVNRLKAQVEGGNLEMLAEINLTAAPKVYLKGNIKNIKSADILQQLNAYYPIPYTSTSGAISAEFDGTFDTLTAGTSNLRLILNKVNLVKDEITYIRKVTADIGIEINQLKITVQPTQVDIEGKVSPLISGQITKLFSASPEPELMITLDTTSLSIAQDVFFEFLPSPLQDADVSGIIAAAIKAGKPDKDWQLVGKINLNNLKLKMGNTLTLSNLNGFIPLASETADPSDFFPHRFRKENYDTWLTELKKYDAANRATLQIESADASIISAKNIGLSPTIYATGARIPLIKLNLFGGTIYGRALTDTKGEYTVILLLNNLSLKQICDSQDSIRGMISGRFNGMMLLNGTELGLNKLRGTIQLWAIPSKEEPRSFSKEFLEKAAGRKLPPLYIQRSYDEAKLSLTIQDGYLVFDDFLMVGKMFGRPMTSIGIDPRGNKVSLTNLIDWMNGLASGTRNIKTEIK